MNLNIIHSLLSVYDLSDNCLSSTIFTTAVEASAQRTLAAEKDVEVRRQVHKTEKVETALQKVRTYLS